MFKWCMLAISFLLFGTLLNVFADGKDKGCLPDHIKADIENLNRLADEAEKLGLKGEAADMRAQAKKLFETEVKKVKLARGLIAGKDLKDDMDVLLLNRCMKEHFISDLMPYLEAVNLVNGLNLTKEQLQTILKCQKKKLELSGDKQWREVLKGYLLVKDGLEKDARMSKQTKDLFFYTEPLHMKLVRRENTALKKELPKLTAAVEKCLTDAQRETIRIFVPCHIPPEEQNDPIRVGQAQNSSHQINMLVNAREIPRGEYDGWFRDVIVPHIRSKVKNWSKCPDCKLELNEKDEITRIRRIFDKARRMKEVEFELEKEALSKKLELCIDPPQPEVDAKGVTKRIGQFLLDTRLIPLLEKRITKLSKQGDSLKK